MITSLSISRPDRPLDQHLRPADRAVFYCRKHDNRRSGVSVLIVPYRNPIATAASRSGRSGGAANGGLNYDSGGAGAPLCLWLYAALCGSDLDALDVEVFLHPLDAGPAIVPAQLPAHLIAAETERHHRAKIWSCAMRMSSRTSA